MALIAGYVAAHPHATSSISTRSVAFAVLPGSVGQTQVLSIATGHLVVKSAPGQVLPPRWIGDDEGNALLVLGFLPEADTLDDLLQHCIRSGGRVLDTLEGEFVAVFADAASRTLHVVNDRFASRPFYLLRRSTATYFSSSPRFLLSLANEQHHPDVVGWLEVCAIGHTIGRRTTVSGLERLEPASHSTITPDGVVSRRYWQLMHRPDDGLDPARHSQAVFEAFCTGARRRARLAPRAVVALSGGLDSRLVAAALPSELDLRLFTFVDVRGAAATVQTEAAAAVAAALGRPHHVAQLPARVAEPEEVIALTGGMRAYQHMAVVMAYVDEARRLGRDLIFGGGPGDVLAGSYIPSIAYLASQRAEECVDTAARQRLSGKSAWTQVFADEVIDQLGRTAEEEVRRSLHDAPGPTAAHRITAWAMTCRQPAFTFTSVLGAHPAVSEVVCHLDYRYTDLMLQLPAAWLYERSFYRYLVFQQLPALRHVPYANTGRVVESRRPVTRLGPLARLRHSALGNQSVIKRGMGWLRRHLRPAQPNRSLVFSDPALVSELQEIVHNAPQLRHIIDLDRCDRLLTHARDGVFPAEEALGTLASLCLSLRIFSRSTAPMIALPCVESSAF